ncbi:MAG: hypothetical protein K2Y27_04315 [Xanthobacteraceae bacterium]|nr:hypothetical protein [Xanthobacteraceae bacterium]
MFAVEEIEHLAAIVVVTRIGRELDAVAEARQRDFEDVADAGRGTVGQTVRVTYKSEPILEPLAVVWDKRRALPRYARDFYESLAAHMHELFPGIRGEAGPVCKD